MNDQALRADALKTSWQIQEAASALGFDWPDVTGVLDKVDEEAREIREALNAGDTAQARRELGDLLLAAVNLARFLEIDPAQALHHANDRFSMRFEALRQELAREGRRIETCTLDELDAVWNRVKVRVGQGLEKGP